VKAAASYLARASLYECRKEGEEALVDALEENGKRSMERDGRKEKEEERERTSSFGTTTGREDTGQKRKLSSRWKGKV